MSANREIGTELDPHAIRPSGEKEIPGRNPTTVWIGGESGTFGK
jgi:hypothetical protein